MADISNTCVQEQRWLGIQRSDPEDVAVGFTRLPVGRELPAAAERPQGQQGTEDPPPAPPGVTP